jgi:hypothetical protein
MYKQHRTYRLMREADGLVWGNESNRLTVRIKKKMEGERYHYLIQVIKTDGRVAHESEMVIDHDSWGGGFVEALNVDEDAELEVVAWGAHEKKVSYFLDHSGGLVQQKPLSEASGDMKTFVRDWHAAHVTDRAAVFLLFFPLAGYYILLGLFLLIVGIWHRRKSESTDQAG